MTGFLTTPHFLSSFEADVRQASAAAGITLEPILLPVDPAERLDASILPNIEIAFFSGDIVANGLGRGFFSAMQSAPNVLELHYVPDALTFKPEHLSVVEEEIRLRCGNMDIRHVAHAGNLPRSANGKLRAVVGMTVDR